MSAFLGALHAVLGDRGLVTDSGALAPHVTDFRGRRSGPAQALALDRKSVV